MPTRLPYCLLILVLSLSYVYEGLSNVRRHAFCRDARVEILCKEK
jgi:hypothetical protein